MKNMREDRGTEVVGRGCLCGQGKRINKQIREELDEFSMGWENVSFWARGNRCSAERCLAEKRR